MPRQQARLLTDNIPQMEEVYFRFNSFSTVMVARFEMTHPATQLLLITVIDYK